MDRIVPKVIASARASNANVVFLVTILFVIGLFFGVSMRYDGIVVLYAGLAAGLGLLAVAVVLSYRNIDRGGACGSNGDDVNSGRRT